MHPGCAICELSVARTQLRPPTLTTLEHRRLMHAPFSRSRCLTNVAADKHFWIARYARIVRCACSWTKALAGHLWQRRRDLAYLTNRVRVAEGRLQVYGTQLQYDSRGCASPRPSEEPALLDARRASVELEPIAEYVQGTMAALGRTAQCATPK